MIAVVAIVGNAAVSHFNIDRMVRYDQTLTQTRAIQTELNKLYSDLKSAETAARGYLLTSEAEYLEPLAEAERAIPIHLEQIQTNPMKSPVTAQKLARVRELVSLKLREIQRYIDLFRTMGREGAITALKEGEGKRLMDELRQDIQSMIQAEETELTEQNSSAESNIYLARVTSLIGSGIAVAVILLASSLVQRELDRREKALWELAESEARFRNLSEVMPQIVWMTRPDGYHEYYNQRWFSYTGMTPEESIGFGWSNPLHRDDRERSQIRWQKSIDTGQSYEVKYRFRRHDGEYRWFLGRAEPVRDASGEIVRWLGTCTDIDEQVRASQQLQENEAYLRSVLDNSPDCVQIFDTSGKLLDMNGPGLAIMQIDDFNQYRLHSWTEAWPESYRPIVQTALNNAQEGRVSRFSGPCPTAKGKVRHWDVIVAPIPDSNGKTIRLISVSRDVTEQKEVERVLSESQRYLESILQSLPSHLAVLEANGDIVTVNENWRQFGVENGLPYDYLWAGQNYFESSRNNRYGELANAGIQAVARGEKDSFQMEYPCHGPNDQRFFTMRVTRFRGDGPVRLVVTHENITERILAERKLAETASQLKQLTDGLPILIWASSAKGEYDYLSLQWVNYTGIPASEQLGSGWLHQVHPDDRDRVAMEWMAAVKRGSEYELEYRVRRYDGEYRWFTALGIPVQNTQGVVVRWYGSCVDIDDQKRQAAILQETVAERTQELREAYEELKATSELLRASNEELEKFAYIASHDLQEPLRKIQAFGDRLTRKYRDVVDENGREYIDRMLDSAGRMRRLIEDLLQFSRITTRVQPFVRVSLNEILSNVLADLEDQIQRTNGQIVVESLPTVVADEVQMRQLFQNLVGNALKFARPGVPPIVTVRATREAHGWRMTVADNGIGFEQQYADRIFELFQRLHGRTQYEGTGLGLAICKKIVTRHGATIQAKSTPGEGTTFIIDWPIDESA